MQEDPRHRNEKFDTSSIGTYLSGYTEELNRALRTVDIAALDQARSLIETAAAAGNHIYVVGNGGSAAIADHLCCDWTKGCHVAGHATTKTISMSSNVALYSAIANDFGFENVFSRQVEFSARSGDVLVAISSSGNSLNILNAVHAAHRAGVSTIGMSGFSGGELRLLSQVSLHIDAKNYGIVEDAHQSLIHILAQYIALHRERNIIRCDAVDTDK